MLRIILLFATILSSFSGDKVFNVGPTDSLAKALDDAAASLKSGDRVSIQVSGTHYLTEPLRLTETHSGLTITAGPGAEPILSGGRVLKGFKPTPDSPGVFEVEIPDVRNGKWFFRQLFVNGERRQRARTPNEGFFRIEGPSPKGPPMRFKFKEGDIKKSWSDDPSVEVIGFVNWTDFHKPIRSIDEASSTVELPGAMNEHIQETNARYFIENAPDGLDFPGEWQLNQKTGVLRYWTKPGEDMSKVEVIAPFLNELMTIRGNLDSKKAAANITLRGLTFSHTEFPMSADGIADSQAASSVRGDVRFEFATNCVIEECSFSHLANYAIEAGRGAQRVQIKYCEIFDIGGGGIRIGEAGKRTEAFEENHSHQITDNHLHQLGRIFPPAVGVFIMQSGTNLVSHNHIHDLYYTAISVGWNWGYQETPCRKNIIEFNHLHDIGQGMLSDMGGIYTLGIQRGTVLRNNLIHDIHSWTYGGWGLYTDEGSSDILLENNVVYRCKSAGFHQHYGRDNVIRNNIFAFNKENQLMRSREEDHNSFTFEQNIVYYDSGELLGSTWKNHHFKLDRNVYFDARANATDKPFKGETLAQWQEHKHDPNSQIADPLFENPGQYDFRLKSNSPALKFGFKPIDVTAVGPRKK